MSCNCCDYGCTASHNCPARPTPATAAERAAQFEAETDRQQHKQAHRAHSQELPNPTAELLQQIDEPSPIEALFYRIGLVACIAGMSFLAGYATGLWERLQ